MTGKCFHSHTIVWWMVGLCVALAGCKTVSATNKAADRNRQPISDRQFAASNFWYEGALLGNGDVGVVVFGAEDRITYAVGKNDMWDRRYYFHLFKPMTFRRYMEMVKSEWPADPNTGRVIPPGDAFDTYEPELVRRDRRAKPLSIWHKPTPKPVCRISIWQPNAKTESGMESLKPVEHTLSLENAELTTATSAFHTITRVQKNANIVLLKLNGLSENTIISLKRNPDATETEIKPAVHTIEDKLGMVVQDMPPERTYPNGFRCAVAATILEGTTPELHGEEILWKVKSDCTLVLTVVTTRDNPQPETAAKKLILQASKTGCDILRQQHIKEWKKFWDASWIKIDDAEVENLWYFCNYMLGSASRPGAVAPGLFSPWIVEDRSAWGGSYTTDYNFQQTFASALSCNHPELLEPYFSALEDMLPAAREFARDIYEADGIAFPHEIYPINMHGQMRATDTYVVETPYLVQHFWEYYEYMQDENFLRKRAYPIIAECADFLASYATYEGDGKYAFEPTRSCEHHGLIPGLPFNKNGTPELAFARYIFKAALKGASLVGEDEQRSSKWKKVLDGLPDYPRIRNQLGDVYLDCEVIKEEWHAAPPVPRTLASRPSKTPGNNGAWMFYNVPTSILQIWPAGQVDMDSPAEEVLTAIRTWMTLKLEGSNDLILRHMVAARLGIPTLEQFKRDVAERLMLNGSVTIKVNPIGKDVSFDKGYFEYWANGIYLENCGLPLVINEMMLQSHNDVIKIFPTMDFYRQAEFYNLRTQGGFLVSAGMDLGFVLWVKIEPTVDRVCRVRLPWPYSVLVINEVSTGEIEVRREGDDILFDAKKGKVYRITPKTLKSRKAEDENGARWSKEKANKWYQKQPWLLGCNFIPSTAINQLEMWQADTFDPETINRELGWAADIGFNSVRVYLHDLSWEADAEGFKKRINRFLDIAERYGIRPIFVIFDDCWNDDPKIGKQPDPIPGVHNSGWLQSPGKRVVNDPNQWGRLERYVKDVLSTFRSDRRIIAWDLYNEPGGSGQGMKSLPLLKKTFQWAREARPAQPLTAGVWNDSREGKEFQLNASDIVTFHNYSDAKNLSRQIAVLEKHGRPIICTEWLRRGHSNVQSHLPIFKKEKVGCYNWGLVSGKTQTIYPWGSKKDAPDPKIWFHDLLRENGSPFDAKEIELIKQLAGTRD